jgi:hypothetical protein
LGSIQAESMLHCGRIKENSFGEPFLAVEKFSEIGLCEIVAEFVIHALW